MTNMANLQRVCSDSRLKNRIHSPFRIRIRNVGTMSPNTVEKIHTVFTLAAFSVGVAGIILIAGMKEHWIRIGLLLVVLENPDWIWKI